MVLQPTQVMDNAFCPATTSTEASPLPIAEKFTKLNRWISEAVFYQRVHLLLTQPRNRRPVLIASDTTDL
jgi:hypothetical protein